MREFWPRATLQVCKNGGNFGDRVNQKKYELYMFPNFPSKRQHFRDTNGKLVYCFRGESIFSHKINLKVFEPFIPRGIREILVRRHIFPLFVYFIHIVENLWAGKGNLVFLTVKYRKKSCLTNQASTKKDISSPPFFSPWQFCRARSSQCCGLVFTAFGLVARLNHEPLAREIGQPLPTLTT